MPVSELNDCVLFEIRDVFFSTPHNGIVLSVGHCLSLHLFVLPGFVWTGSSDLLLWFCSAQGIF